MVDNFDEIMKLTSQLDLKDEEILFMFSRWKKEDGSLEMLQKIKDYQDGIIQI